MDGDLNTGLLNRWVMMMREAGISPKSRNTLFVREAESEKQSV